jgi:uncharacterized membrane protein
MAVLQTVAGVLEPWKDLYSGSTALSVTLTFAHLGSMMVGGGLAIAADRTVLKAGRLTEPKAVLALADAVGDVHRPVVIALIVSGISGSMQLAADVETFAVSKVMWVKLGLLFVLGINGLLMLRDEKAVRRESGSGKGLGALRMRAVTSVVLWLAITLAGVGLMQG